MVSLTCQFSLSSDKDFHGPEFLHCIYAGDEGSVGRGWVAKEGLGSRGDFLCPLFEFLCRHVTIEPN